MILAGDIGGTKTVLALYDNQLVMQRRKTYPSQSFPGLAPILADFLGDAVKPAAAGFGIAGPVRDGACTATNLPWQVSVEDIAAHTGIDRVALVNDLVATAHGLMYLPDEAFVELNPGTAQIDPQGTIAVLAAGTGLGEAIVCRVGDRITALPTEGGHTDFAPRNERDDRLLAYLRSLYPDHVSNERVISGLGIPVLYDFLDNESPHVANPELAAALDAGEGAAAIGLHALGGDPQARTAIDWFCDLYGAEAGNMALKTLATGGVILGGGIAPKLLPILREGGFWNAFTAKGRFRDLLVGLSVRVCLDQDAALLGAAAVAS
ncbi:MAG: glucokinase [Gammaproteobacteria bacterium]|nr:glucokinase [Gammaproteobacteria bacterium]MCP5136518.1 glucokinase [Gammaproteobacteria bacterium]